MGACLSMVPPTSATADGSGGPVSHPRPGPARFLGEAVEVWVNRLRESLRIGVGLLEGIILLPSNVRGCGANRASPDGEALVHGVNPYAYSPKWSLWDPTPIVFYHPLPTPGGLTTAHHHSVLSPQHTPIGKGDCLQIAVHRQAIWIFHVPEDTEACRKAWPSGWRPGKNCSSARSPQNARQKPEAQHPARGPALPVAPAYGKMPDGAEGPGRPRRGATKNSPLQGRSAFFFATSANHRPLSLTVRLSAG